MTWEFIISYWNSIPVIIAAGVGAGFLRSFAGWIENALKDGVVTKFELKKLGGTIIKYVAGIALIVLGVEVPAAVALMFGIDLGTSALKSTRVKK